MKYVILICDGAADHPIKELGGRTPLQAADKPNMDAVAKSGRSGLLETVPEGYPPGSDVANLSILGYDPDLYYPGGRGVIEAASVGINIAMDEIPMRANIITVENGRIMDYSAGNIKNEESASLIEAANKAFGSKQIRFYPGVSYRNLLVIKDKNLNPQDLEFDAPHDHQGEPVEAHLARGRGTAEEWAKKLNRIMLDSQRFFEKHDVNIKRAAEGKKPANMLWFWGPGRKKREMPSLKQRFGINGVVVTGIDLIKGLGKLAGLEPVNVEGATAYFDTNYEGKADAASDALNSGKDLALIHVEAPDEASHEGSIKEKVKAIENIDERLLGRLMRDIDDEFRIAILPDHYTSIGTRKHEAGAVPFTVMGPGIEHDSVERFDEDNAGRGGYGLRKGHELVWILFAKRGSVYA